MVADFKFDSIMVGAGRRGDRHGKTNCHISASSRPETAVYGHNWVRQSGVKGILRSDDGFPACPTPTRGLKLRITGCVGNWLTAVYTYTKPVVLIFVAFYFFFAPLGILITQLQDPGLKNGEMPRFLYDWHVQLSENYELWARERVVSSRATQLNVNNISGTEWPIFSSVYYLWATEALQEAWEDDPSLAPEMPTEYAKGAIETAVSLIADPNHATWVEQHWGDDYLTQENLFYRMLLISGLTSYQNLTEDVQYEPLLLAQVESLSRE
ncbi:MAG: hypothetical protein GY943_39310, partial [Chloroflexi bacterium]|nr:hypothetical protein [Chloroflexota bacterium]